MGESLKRSVGLLPIYVEGTKVKMFMRVILVLSALAGSSSLAYSQSETVEASLKPLDFALVRVGVANPRKGAKSASSFVEVSGGFSLNGIAGCRITLRNEVVDKGQRFIYDVVIPLAELSSKGDISEAVGEVGPPGSSMGQEFYPWHIRYDVKSRGRTVILHDRVRKRILARGAHVSFVFANAVRSTRLQRHSKKRLLLVTSTSSVVLGV